MGPLRGRETLAREGACADERASTEGSEQKISPSGHRGSTTPAGCPRRSWSTTTTSPSTLSTRQGERHSALHLRAARRPEDSRRGRKRKLAAVALKLWSHNGRLRQMKAPAPH